MPTGTKIAAIVLVVLLGAAGLYYAFVPPAPAPKFDPTKASGSSVTDPLSRPSTLPPAGSSASTGTAAGIDALANRAGVGAPGVNSTGTVGTTPSPIPGMNNTAPAGAVAGANTVPGTAVPGTTISGATNSTAPRAAFNNGFRNGPGTAPSPGTSVGTAGSGTITGTSSSDPTGLAVGGTGGTVGTSPSGSTAPGSTTTGPTGIGTGAGSSNGLTASNPTGVAPSNSGNTTGSETTYVVKKGDSFESISKSIYGTTTKWKDIAKANPTVDPTRMKIGAKLRIPAAGASISNETAMASAATKPSSSASSSKSTTKTASAASATNGGTHVVAKGDTFSSLARSYYGDSKFWKAIAKANPKISEKSLAIGTKLAIPPKSTVVSGGNVER